MQATTLRSSFVAGVAALSACWFVACGRPGPQFRSDLRPPARPAAALPVYQSEVAEDLGVAIAIVVDTSGSMAKAAPGDQRPKHQVAREAVTRMLTATAAFQQKRADLPVKVGVLHFASSAWVLLPMQPYDPAAVERALERMPAPGGGTAIGDAMLAARRELYRSGVYRKYMLVVTDGENTSGADPAKTAREIHARSEGGVGLYFVAFDTDPKKFGFLRPLGGEVVAASNSTQLGKALDDIYQGKILAEADYGEDRAGQPTRKSGAPR